MWRVRRRESVRRLKATVGSRIKRLVQKPSETIPAITWHESGPLRGSLARLPKAPRRADASVVIVEDPANATMETTIVCGLVGGALVATTGATVAFRRGMSTPRFVHITAAFMQNHLSLSDDIWYLLRAVGVQWKMRSVDDLAAVVKSDLVGGGGRREKPSARTQTATDPGGGQRKAQNVMIFCRVGGLRSF